MAKKDYTADFVEIKKMTNRIKGLNESISFDDDFEDDGFEEDDECPNGVCTPNDNNIEGDASNAVNKIREIALKGMVALCNTPEDPQYEVLKQIFNYCDKANKKKEEMVEK